METIGPDGYTFTALIDLYPEVKLGQYKGLSAPWENAELSDDDTNEAIQRFLTEHLVEQEQDRAAMGDEVTLDFEGFVDGVPFEGGKGEGYPLLLGSGMFIPGFEEQVAGIRPGGGAGCPRHLPHPVCAGAGGQGCYLPRQGPPHRPAGACPS